MNILNEYFCEKYKVVSSELVSDGIKPICMKIELSDGYILNVELKLFDVTKIYEIIDEALDNYYLMKYRKNKLNKIKTS